MALKALVVGGCPQPYHRLEPVKPLFEEIFKSMEIEPTVTGIFHPDGGSDWTGDYSALTEESLANYDLLLLYTTGNERYGARPEAIIEFVESGKALIGVHNATDTFTNDPAFVALMGGRFRHHPAQLDVATEILDRTHPITQGVSNFTVHDELYLFQDFHPENVHLLIQTRSYEAEGAVPLCWTREQGKGRVFYLSLGHNPSVVADPNWRKLFKNGVGWALGQK